MEESDEDHSTRLRRMERRNQGRQGRNLDRERRLEGVPVRVRQPVRGRAGHQSGGADRRRARRLLHYGSLQILGEAKLTAEEMETSAKVTLEQVDGGYAITAVHLTLHAKIPGADQATLEKLSSMAKAGCPVSKLVKAEITLNATLIS